MAKSKKSKTPSSTIAVNRKARFDYFIEDRLEAGIQLEGWEVKSLRAGKGNIAEGYVYIKNNEAWLIGSHFTPLDTTCTHIVPNPTRTRKLLLNFREIKRLSDAVGQKGYTILGLSLYWKRNLVKLEIGLGKGKQQQDKRSTEKEREWTRQKSRILKHT